MVLKFNHNEFLSYPNTYNQIKFGSIDHLIRTNMDDSMRQVVFKHNTYAPRSVDIRRPGKPRGQWIVETMTEAFDEIMNNEWLRYEVENEEVGEDDGIYDEDDDDDTYYAREEDEY